MQNRKGKKDAIPEEFSSEEAAGRFWDTHDSVEYLDEMQRVEADVCLERRRFEVEVDAEVAAALSQKAKQEHVTVSCLANELLRKQLTVH